jgi:hypothetical protein
MTGGFPGSSMRTTPWNWSAISSAISMPMD